MLGGLLSRQEAEEEERQLYEQHQNVAVSESAQDVVLTNDNKYGSLDTNDHSFPYEEEDEEDEDGEYLYTDSEGGDSHTGTLQVMSKKRKTSGVEFEYTGRLMEEVPKDVTILRFHSSIGEVRPTFEKCKQLKEVVFNEGLTKIWYESFSNCDSLEHINLPSTLIEIGDAAFSSCRRLETVILNEGLKKIGQSAFASCTSLECITIPHTVTEISKFTFWGCENLREIGLHEGIQRIPQSAFGGPSALQRLTFPNLSTRLETIIQTQVEDKIDNIRDLVERSGSEMFISGEASIQHVWGPNWIRTRGILGRIDRLLTYYELKEATTLLELAFWKSNIDQVEMKRINNRDHYRIDIPGPVKDTILQYLQSPDDSEDDSSSSSSSSDGESSDSDSS